MRVAWSCIITVVGGSCVTIVGICTMFRWCVGSWFVVGLCRFSGRYILIEVWVLLFWMMWSVWGLKLDCGNVCIVVGFFIIVVITKMSVLFV